MADSTTTALRKEGMLWRPGLLTLQRRLLSVFRILLLFPHKSTAQMCLVSSLYRAGWSPASDPLSGRLSEGSVCGGLALGCWGTGSLFFPSPVLRRSGDPVSLHSSPGCRAAFLWSGKAWNLPGLSRMAPLMSYKSRIISPLQL